MARESFQAEPEVFAVPFIKLTQGDQTVLIPLDEWNEVFNAYEKAYEKAKEINDKIHSV